MHNTMGPIVLKDANKANLGILPVFAKSIWEPPRCVVAAPPLNPAVLPAGMFTLPVSSVAAPV
jgi:hypothetical protein